MFSTKWLLFFSLSLTIQAADPWLGTWKIDLKKSHFENFDIPKDMKLVITQHGDQNILDFTFTQGDGKAQSASITQPIKGGVLGHEALEPGSDLATLEVPDDHHWIYKYSKDGKLVSTRTVTLSPDGKVHQAKMTSMQNGKKVVENEYMVKVDSALTK
jgi:hypothetical protein